jgi:hypothetical protein|nr:MAG TPA: shock protein B [Herelleviridae sp.]
MERTGIINGRQCTITPSGALIFPKTAGEYKLQQLQNEVLELKQEIKVLKRMSRQRKKGW